MGRRTPDPAVGAQYGRLTVQAAAVTLGRYKRVPVLCSCGKEFLAHKSTLLSGKCQSCGCLNAELTAQRFRKHEQGTESLNSSWRGMMHRCYAANDPGAKNYSARGITVCARWHDFKNFAADMGPRPEGLTLERRNNNEGYSKESCSWVTKKQQVLNKRNTVWVLYKGDRMHLFDLSLALGTSHRRLYYHLILRQRALPDVVLLPREIIKYKPRKERSANETT